MKPKTIIAPKSKDPSSERRSNLANSRTKGVRINIENSNILPFGGETIMQQSFLPKKDADKYYKKIIKETKWQQHYIRIFGRKMPQPRLTAWYGEEGTSYSYSGIRLEPTPFSKVLLEIKERIEKECGYNFNCVLLNLYRNQNDSMGWHSDDEKELGTNPVIASLSLGETRNFQLRHKTEKAQKINIPLAHGSLMQMKGETQHHWQHAVPKCTSLRGSRINLTFRKIDS